MYCQDCGAQNHDTNLHCTECGRLLAPRLAGTDGDASRPASSGPSLATDNPGRRPNSDGRSQLSGQNLPAHHAPQPYGGPNHPARYYQQKSRLGAGLMQLLLPMGIGRLYLGYTAIGLAQLFTAIFCGVGVLWAFIDGIIILTGSPETDANGVTLKD